MTPQPRQPVADIPVLELDLEDVNVLAIAFGPDDRLYFVADDQAVNLWNVLVAATEYLTVAIALLGFIIAFVALRALLRRRRVGPLFCRKCDYDLTGAVNNTCSECGIDLTRYPPLRRRTFTRRAWFRLTLAVLILTLASTPWLIGVGRVKAWAHGRMTWWNFALAEYDGKWKWSGAFNEYVSRLIAVDPRSGEQTEVAILHGWAAAEQDRFDLAFSPSGRRLLIKEGAMEGATLVAIDLPSGRRHPLHFLRTTHKPTTWTSPEWESESTLYVVSIDTVGGMGRSATLRHLDLDNGVDKTVQRVHDDDSTELMLASVLSPSRILWTQLVWNRAQDDVIRLTDDEGSILASTETPRRRRLLLLPDGRMIRLNGEADILTPTLNMEGTLPGAQLAEVIALSPNGERMVAITTNERGSIWDARSLAVQCEFPCTSQAAAIPVSVAISNRARFVAVHHVRHNAPDTLRLLDLRDRCD